MSKTVIIYAHPKTKGHCPLILEEVKKNLKKRKIAFEVIDLYKLKYDPVLHEKEHYTSRGREISPQNKKFQEKIKKTTHFIFITPVWWNGVPAILKGFLDRVLTARFAFAYKGSIPVKLLKGKRASTIMTTGSPKPLHLIFQGGRAGRVFCKDTLGFCGIKAKPFYIGNAKRVTDGQKTKIKKVTKNAISWLY